MLVNKRITYLAVSAVAIWALFAPSPRSFLGDEYDVSMIILWRDIQLSLSS